MLSLMSCNAPGIYHLQWQPARLTNRAFWSSELAALHPTCTITSSWNPSGEKHSVTGMDLRSSLPVRTPVLKSYTATYPDVPCVQAQLGSED